MSEVQFCRLLLMYMPGSSSLDKEKKRKMLKRISAIYRKKSTEDSEEGSQSQDKRKVCRTVLWFAVSGHYAQGHYAQSGHYAQM